METKITADQIDEKIRLLEIGREKLMVSVNARATAIGAYYKKRAIVLIKLTNGESLSLESEVVQKPAATISKEIAKGICWEELMQMELTDSEYFSNLAKMKSVQAELNGLQSKNKWLESN